MKTGLAILFFLITPLGLFGQNDSAYSKKHPSKLLLEDFDYLVNALEKTHPGLYWHTDTAEFINWMGFLRETIRNTDSLTETEFYRKAALLNFAISCAHTSIDFSGKHEQWWKQKALLLPFNIITLNGKYYVYQNYSNDTLLDVGSEIIAIDGRPINEIIDIIFQYIPADGHNSSRRKNVLKTGFYFYYSLAIKESAPTYKIKCTPKGLNNSTITTVKGITYKTLNEKRSSLKKPISPIHFSLIDSVDAGILKIATFRKDLFEKEGVDFEKTLDSVFNVLKEKNTGNLIIDLRDNGGGLSEYGAALISYLSPQPFVYCKNQWLTTDSLFSFMEYDIPETFLGFPAGIVKEDNGYKWKKHSVLGTRQNKPNYFNGRVYIITNGRCASTTVEVVSLAKTYKLAKIVGEEAGGSYKGNTSGVTGTVVLPHTKLVVSIPLVRFEMPVDPLNSSGLLPDYNIKPTIEEWLMGTDTEMETVIGLIKKTK
jgi:hypothetical protein